MSSWRIGRMLHLSFAPASWASSTFVCCISLEADILATRQLARPVSEYQLSAASQPASETAPKARACGLMGAMRAVAPRVNFQRSSEAFNLVSSPPCSPARNLDMKIPIQFLAREQANAMIEPTKGWRAPHGMRENTYSPESTLCAHPAPVCGSTWRFRAPSPGDLDEAQLGASAQGTYFRPSFLVFRAQH